MISQRRYAAVFAFTLLALPAADAASYAAFRHTLRLMRHAARCSPLAYA